MLAEGLTRDRIAQEINERGVPCYQGSCSEVYLEKAFDGTGWRPAQPLAVARELGETSLMFLVHPTLEDHHIMQTCGVLAEVMHRSEEHTSELQSLMRISYAVFCLKKKQEITTK